MAAIKVCSLLLLSLTIILAAYLVEGCGNKPVIPSARRLVLNSYPFQRQDKDRGDQERMKKAAATAARWIRRRIMIGSTAPICTFNECRGCKYKCRAEQVPVEGNDPIHSAYHYRCVCYR